MSIAMSATCAFAQQAAPPAPPQAAAPDLHLAGVELVKSARSSTFAIVVGIGGGILTGLVASQSDEAAPVAAMGAITAIGTMSFSLSAIGHKRKAGRALIGSK